VRNSIKVNLNQSSLKKYIKVNDIFITLHIINDNYNVAIMLYAIYISAWEVSLKKELVHIHFVKRKELGSFFILNIDHFSFLDNFKIA